MMDQVKEEYKFMVKLRRAMQHVLKCQCSTIGHYTMNSIVGIHISQGVLNIEIFFLEFWLHHDLLGEKVAYVFSIQWPSPLYFGWIVNWYGPNLHDFFFY